jgi:putative tricarboxylic transport membrane protein
MEVFSNLLLGFETVFQPTMLLYCFLGVFLGTFIGVLPGIGSLTAVVLLLPFSFYMDPISSIIFLAGIYYGAEYGGSTAAILLNIPGTISSSITCIEGYQMTRQGRAGVALFMACIASLIGGIIGILCIILFSPLIADIGLMFGPTENFCLMLLGLIAACLISNKSSIKGLSMVIMGLILGTVGIDNSSGIARFHFDFVNLMGGITLIILAMSFFGISEITNNITASELKKPIKSVSIKEMIPTVKDFRDSISAIFRGSFIGSLFGALPGTGPSISSFVSYAIEKRYSKNKNNFGKGSIEGVVGPEASNNAAAQTAFIPTLTLGLPGTATMAIIIGALMIHGIQPGPALISQNPALFWGLIASFFIGNLILVILNIPLVSIWVSILKIPYHILYPIILSLIIMGVYSVSQNPFDIYLLTFFSVIGYFLYKCDYEFAPLLLAFVLGPMMEENLKRALAVSRGDYMIFLDKPIALILLSISALMVSWILFSLFTKK